MYVDNTGISWHDEPSKVDVTQSDKNYSSQIESVEIRSRDFPLDEELIKEAINDEKLYSIMAKVNHKVSGWAVFHAEGNDIFVDRLSVVDGPDLPEVIHALFGTITWNPAPLGRSPVVTLVWPEHSVDRPLFKHLLSTGWKTSGLVKDRYDGYGQLWDGILIRKQF